MMRDEELHDQMENWSRRFDEVPVPAITVIRRRARRRRAQVAAAGGVALAAVGAGIGLIAVRPAGRPPGQAAPGVVKPFAAPSSGQPSSRLAKPVPAPACRGGALQVEAPASTASVNGGMPGLAAVIYFRNVGQGTCVLEGWPTLAPLGADGRPMAVRMLYGVSSGTWSVPVTRVVIGPGSRAAVSLLVARPETVGACAAPRTAAWAWAVTPPGGHRRVVVHEPSAAAGSAYEPCPGDEVMVSPVRPGSLPLVGADTASPLPGAPTAGLFSVPPRP